MLLTEGQKTLNASLIRENGQTLQNHSHLVGVYYFDATYLLRFTCIVARNDFVPLAPPSALSFPTQQFAVCQLVQ